MNRFEFQQSCARGVSGKILNIGCKEDPSGLKKTYGDRVVNMDIRDFDHDVFYNTGKKVSIPVDLIHDATQYPYPFKDDEFDLVVLGDILEDLPDNECQLDVLKEVHRVSKRVAITTPEDTPERDWHHFTTITEERLKKWLMDAGWKIESFEVVDYGFVPRGYFVLAYK